MAEKKAPQLLAGAIAKDERAKFINDNIVDRFNYREDLEYDSDRETYTMNEFDHFVFDMRWLFTSIIKNDDERNSKEYHEFIKKLREYYNISMTEEDVEERFPSEPPIDRNKKIGHLKYIPTYDENGLETKKDYSELYTDDHWKNEFYKFYHETPENVLKHLMDRFNRDNNLGFNEIVEAQTAAMIADNPNPEKYPGSDEAIPIAELYERKRRDILASAVKTYAGLGTPNAIKEALERLDYTNVKIIENIPGVYYNRAHEYNGEEDYGTRTSQKNWPYFSVALAPKHKKERLEETEQGLRKFINKYKNARSILHRIYLNLRSVFVDFTDVVDNTDELIEDVRVDDELLLSVESNNTVSFTISTVGDAIEDTDTVNISYNLVNIVDRSDNKPQSFDVPLSAGVQTLGIGELDRHRRLENIVIQNLYKTVTYTENVDYTITYSENPTTTTAVADDYIVDDLTNKVDIYTSMNYSTHYKAKSKKETTFPISFKIVNPSTTAVTIDKATIDYNFVSDDSNFITAEVINEKDYTKVGSVGIDFYQTGSNNVEYEIPNIDYTGLTFDDTYVSGNQLGFNSQPVVLKIAL